MLALAHEAEIRLREQRRHRLGHRQEQAGDGVAARHPDQHESARVVWGRHDPFFLPAGAEAFKRDNPEAQGRFLDTGHLALETHGDEIAQAMLAFLDRHL